MSESLRELRSMSDDEIVERYDRDARRVGGVGIDFWLDELDRRDAVRAAVASAASEAASLKLAHRSYWLSVISAVTSVAALIVAMVTLVVTS